MATTPRTPEEARALAWQAAEARRERARRSRERALRGNPAAARALFDRTKALMRTWSGR